jgi:ribosomal protein S27AE
VSVYYQYTLDPDICPRCGNHRLMIEARNDNTHLIERKLCEPCWELEWRVA